MSKVYSIEWDRYSRNPMSKYCHLKLKEQGIDHEILKLDDLGDYIERCNHSKFFLNNIGRISYVGDQLRLLLAMEIPNFAYIDLDAWINVPVDFENKSYCFADVYNNKIRYNDGTFYSVGDNKEYAEWLFNIYQKYYKDLKTNGVWDVNYIVADKFTPPESIKRPEPLFIKCPSENGDHFYISQFERFKNCTEERRVVYYTRDKAFNPKWSEIQYWSLSPENNLARNGSFQNRVFFWNVKNEDDFRLWQNQLCYTLGNPCIKFVELN